MKALRRHLISDGLVGEVPLWYRVIQAARYLRVEPWDLLDRSAFWIRAAEESMAAEAAAERHRAKRRASSGKG